RWLQVEVKGPNDAAFVLLTPRQEILAVPYALWSAGGGGLTLPFLGVASAPIPLFEVRNTSLSNLGQGLRAQTNSGTAVEGFTSRGDGDAVLGVHQGDGSGAGVHGDGQQFQKGVWGTAQQVPGVLGFSQATDGVLGTTANGRSGVRGEINSPVDTAAGVMG